MKFYDDLYIGGVIDFKTKAKTVWNYKNKHENLGENELGYVIYFELFHVRIHLLKTSPEAKAFKKWIRETKGIITKEMVAELAYNFARPYISFENLMDFKKQIEKCAFISGQQDARRAVCVALGLSR